MNLLSEHPEQTAASVLFFSVSVWQRFAHLTPAQIKEAALAADDVLNRYPPGSGDVKQEIPHFGECSYNKAVAIASCYIVSRAKTEHLDSPLLAAARQAKFLV